MNSVTDEPSFGVASLAEVEGEEVWVPFGHIYGDSQLNEDSASGEEGELVVSTWLAEQEGWL